MIIEILQENQRWWWSTHSDCCYGCGHVCNVMHLKKRKKKPNQSTQYIVLLVTWTATDTACGCVNGSVFGCTQS